MAKCCCGSRRAVAVRRWANLRSRAEKHQRLRGHPTTRASPPAAAPAQSLCLERRSEERHFTTKRVPVCGAEDHTKTHKEDRNQRSELIPGWVDWWLCSVRGGRISVGI